MKAFLGLFSVLFLVSAAQAQPEEGGTGVGSGGVPLSAMTCQQFKQEVGQREILLSDDSVSFQNQQASLDTAEDLGGTIEATGDGRLKITVMLPLVNFSNGAPSAGPISNLSTLQVEGRNSLETVIRPNDRVVYRITCELQ